MVASAVTTLAGTLMTILSGTGAIRPQSAPVLATTAIVATRIPVAVRTTVPVEIINAPVVRPALTMLDTDDSAAAIHSIRFVQTNAMTRRFDAGAELPHFADPKINRDSNSVRSLRLSTTRRFGANSDPIATRLQLRLTGDANSLNADVRFRGSVADAIGRQLRD